jgi:hypothetical protein
MSLKTRDGRPIKRARGYDPLVTNAQVNNAQVNRRIAGEAFAAGLTPREIADEWPRVFYLNVDAQGRETIGQLYDTLLDDGRGETRYTITRESLAKAIARKGA